MPIHTALFEILEQANIRYPVGPMGEKLVIPVPSGNAKRISGRSFFPGGSGNSEGEQFVLPKNPILVLGNNFGSFGYYNECVQFLYEEPLTNSTWRQLLDIDTQVGLNPRLCFHSNVFMGFTPGHRNSDPMVIKEDFRADCYSFLKQQISLINPRAIIAVGAKAKTALSVLSGGQIILWTSAIYAELYRTGHFSQRDISLSLDTGTASWKGDVIAMTHPSLRKGNFRKTIKKHEFDPEPIELHGLMTFAKRNT